MAAGRLRADSSEGAEAATGARAGGDRVDATTDAATEAAIEAILGRTVTQLDEARADVALASRIEARLRDQIERLARRLDDSEAERLELLEKVRHRDRLLSQIFASRAWRWSQALRRALGRR